MIVNEWLKNDVIYWHHLCPKMDHIKSYMIDRVADGSVQCNMCKKKFRLCNYMTIMDYLKHKRFPTDNMGDMAYKYLRIGHDKV